MRFVAEDVEQLREARLQRPAFQPGLYDVLAEACKVLGRSLRDIAANRGMPFCICVEK